MTILKKRITAALAIGLASPLLFLSKASTAASAADTACANAYVASDNSGTGLQRMRYPGADVNEHMKCNNTKEQPCAYVRAAWWEEYDLKWIPNGDDAGTDPKLCTTGTADTIFKHMIAAKVNPPGQVFTLQFKLSPDSAEKICGNANTVVTFTVSASIAVNTNDPLHTTIQNITGTAGGDATCSAYFHGYNLPKTYTSGNPGTATHARAANFLIRFTPAGNARVQQLYNQQ